MTTTLPPGYSIARARPPCKPLPPTICRPCFGDRHQGCERRLQQTQCRCIPCHQREMEASIARALRSGDQARMIRDPERKLAELKRISGVLRSAVLDCEALRYSLYAPPAPRSRPLPGKTPRRRMIHVNLPLPTPVLCPSCKRGVRHDNHSPGACQCYQCSSRLIAGNIRAAVADFGPGAPLRLMDALHDALLLLGELYRRKQQLRDQPTEYRQCRGDDCNTEIPWIPGLGQPPRWCSYRCKERYHRAMRRAHGNVFEDDDDYYAPVPRNNRWESREAFLRWWAEDQERERQGALNRQRFRDQVAGNQDS